MRETAIAAEVLGAVSRDRAAAAAASALTEAGGDVYAVGGVVRDVLLGVEPEDVDLMVRGLTPDEARDALGTPRGATVKEVGRDFGIFEMYLGGGVAQVALPRTERSTGAGHRSFEVSVDPHMPVEEDLWRRDFTCNAMAVRLSDARLLDPAGGADAALDYQVVPTTEWSMAEDPLRLLRALSLVSRRRMRLGGDALELIRRHAAALAHLPAERVQAELDKIFAGDNPHGAVRLARYAGVLAAVLPEVDACFGYDQRTPWHERELGDHLVAVLAGVARANPDRDVRLAALLHDIGKPASAWVDPDTGHNHYYETRLDDGTTLGADHARVGAEMAVALMGRLRYPHDRIMRVGGLVRHHMFAGFDSERGARRFLARVGDLAEDLIDIRRADSADHHEVAPMGSQWDPERNAELVRRVRGKAQAFDRRHLVVTGRDLIGAGVPEGPEVGRALDRLVEAVLEDPDLNDRDALLRLL